MKASDRGWQTARELFAALKPHFTPNQVALWEKFFEENEPF